VSAFAIREESPQDHSQVRVVNEAAFGRPDEADLIDRLRHEGAALLSLVAERENQVVGHVMFSRMTILTAQGPLAAVSLAPMAVRPENQHQEIGSQLIRRGLDMLRERGERIVIVLGHKDYYPRFGFSSDLARNLTSPFPPEAFMALELVTGSLAGVQGEVRYPATFGI
jgi:putative acetyltransferase